MSKVERCVSKVLQKRVVATLGASRAQVCMLLHKCSSLQHLALYQACKSIQACVNHTPACSAGHFAHLM